ncbi:Monogalactosyldiacylglycerol synthase 1, chloroplastic [Porphyridium purpureum]|uniref:monogalactosyldiacylglycerol synthase n=1 Tax=Porphyridium purpureum TaxID=35688 RepID=A0A5J4ZBL0_PORPP|nr:Monogalactosyldiacylglycerol synthase 1, chloroplastic [Porphyridium purpureum]|eukprot:POR5938..scf295_1
MALAPGRGERAQCQPRRRAAWSAAACAMELAAVAAFAGAVGPHEKRLVRAWQGDHARKCAGHVAPQTRAAAPRAPQWTSGSFAGCALSCARSRARRGVRGRDRILSCANGGGGSGRGGKGGKRDGHGGSGRGEDDGFDEQLDLAALNLLGLLSWRPWHRDGQECSVQKKKRVLILMSDTGGGHRASAQALEAAFRQLFGAEYEVTISDMFVEIAGRPFHKFPQQYSYAANHPWFWKAVYYYAGFPGTRQITENISYWLMQKKLRDALLEMKPDLVVSVHPLCQELPLRALKKLKRRDVTRFVTVVTDLGGGHPTWFHKGVDACFVPSNEVYKLAKRAGLKDDQIVKSGLPIRQSFWRAASKSKSRLRRELGLKPDVPAALVIGGGDGVGGLRNVAVSMAETLGQECGSRGGQLVIVCGRNEALRKNLQSLSWPVHVVVKGFVSNMSDYMAACDTIVTKAGPGTIAEAVIRKLPIIVSGYLPGQEYGNVRFVVDNHVGVYEPDPHAIARVVVDWFGHPQKLKQLSDRAAVVARPEATLDIARRIHALLSSSRS